MGNRENSPTKISNFSENLTNFGNYFQYMLKLYGWIGIYTFCTESFPIQIYPKKTCRQYTLMNMSCLEAYNNQFNPNALLFWQTLSIVFHF